LRTAYDSVNALAIPVSAEIVCGYVDGIYAWSAADWARFPDAVHVPISAIGTDRGIVGDVEQGCIWPPAAAVPWVRKRRDGGVDPTIYCNETYHWPLVKAAFTAAHVAQPHYWCSNYDGIAVLRPGQVARQYANPTLTKHHYDLSVVADHWPGVDGLYTGGSGSLGDDMLADERKALFDLRDNYLTRNKPIPVGTPGGETFADWFTRWDGQLKTAATTAQLIQAVADLKAAISAVPPGTAVVDFGPVLTAIGNVQAKLDQHLK
jgi:hypothetical protein